MKTFLFTLLLFIFSFQLSSQYSLEWASVVGFKLSESYIDMDSNIYLAGNYNTAVDFDPGPGFQMRTPEGGYDFYILKLDKKGKFKWVRTFGTTACRPCHDEVSDIEVDKFGNVVVSGSYFGPLDFDPHPVNTFIMKAKGFNSENYLLKLDSNGDFLWAKKFVNNNFASSNSQIEINQNAQIYYITGFTDSIDADPTSGTQYFKSPTGFDNTLIVKLKPSGSLIWAKSLSGGFSSVNEFVVDSNSNLFLTGQYRGIVDFDINASVNTLNSGTSWNGYVLKLTSDTNFGFVKELTNSGSGIVPLDVFPTSSGDILMGGYYFGTTDFDPGTSTLSKTAVNSAGDAFILKLNANGNYQRVFSFGGVGVYNNRCSAIQEDTSGNLYFSGEFQDTVDFNPGSQISEMTSAGTLDAFLLKTTANLDYINSFSVGGNQWELVENLYVGTNNELFLIGSLTSTVGDLDPSTTTYPISMPPGNAMANYVLKININPSSTSGIKALNPSLELSLYPNPTNGLLKLESTSDAQYSIKIISSLGQLVYQKNNLTGNNQIDVSKLPSGAYMLLIYDQQANQAISKRFIRL